MGISQREMIAELMDAPDLDAAQHDAALHGLRRLNGLSRAGAIMARQVGRLAHERGLSSLTLLDVACGGGDVPIGIAQALRQRRCEVALTLTDRSPRALALAQAAALAAGLAVEIYPG
ncbi:MAG TPA: nucleotide-binding protein, partial [Phycisphaerae bacterium]|nr:nucleotide-binding protein [Phycisphaerae bacterium]